MLPGTPRAAVETFANVRCLVFFTCFAAVLDVDGHRRIIDALAWGFVGTLISLSLAARRSLRDLSTAYRHQRSVLVDPRRGLL